MSGALCVVAGCDRPIKVRSRGLCAAHDARRRRGTDMTAPVQVHDSTRTCSVAGCDRPYRASGVCAMHEQRTLRGTDMDAPPRVTASDREATHAAEREAREARWTVYVGALAAPPKPTPPAIALEDVDEDNWRQAAACRNQTAVMFPRGDGAGYARDARALCMACPVREPHCTELALSYPASDVHGMWAAMTPRQIAAEQERRGIRPTEPTLAALFESLAEARWKRDRDRAAQIQAVAE